MSAFGLWSSLEKSATNVPAAHICPQGRHGSDVCNRVRRPVRGPRLQTAGGMELLRPTRTAQLRSEERHANFSVGAADGRLARALLNVATYRGCDASMQR